jgi:S-adenosylhomocysteine hydrolase
MRFDDAYLPADPFERRVVKFFAERQELDAPRHLVARAIVTALADATDHGGVLAAQQVAETLGDKGLALLLQARGQATSTTTRAKLKHQELDPLTLQKVARSRDRTTFVERMPLLAELTRHLGSPKALAGFQMVSVQHLFPSTLGLYDALKDNGLVRNETGVGGKNYSSNADAVARLVADGHDVHPLAMPEPQDAGLNAEELVYTMAVSQLATLFRDVDPKETRPRFLLLDDGGKLIRALHEAFAHLCVAVEQTDRGIQHIEMMASEGHELACPVVNMARSVAKKDHEGPTIGESVVFHAEHELRATSPELLALVEKDKTATVVGYGAVGKATADALQRRGYTVFVTDTDPARLAAATADGCTSLAREQALASGTLVFGCTGRTSLPPSDFALLKDGAVLVNAASGNHEFGLHDVSSQKLASGDANAVVDDNGLRRSQFLGINIVVGDTAEGEAIQNRVIRGKSGKEILALRSGYVVNMTLGLPPEFVQLTLGLLLAGCLQAVQEQGPGLKDIPASTQNFLVARTEKHLGRLGLDLHAPDFRALDTWAA